MDTLHTEQDAAGTLSATGQLFDLGPADTPPAAPPACHEGAPRLRYANRAQMSMRCCSLDDLIPEDHQVRIVWDYVAGLDLTPMLQKIAATEGHPGAPAIDPRILMTSWLYATLRGVGSARELNRRCDRQQGEVPFQWICGDVRVNYHTLADFRTAHGKILDDLLTSSVATLRDRKSTRLNSSHIQKSRMPSSA